MSRYSGLALGVLAALVCGRLGLWQLDRLAQRRALNARMMDQLARPAVDAAALRPVSAATARDLDFRRARVIGRFDFQREVVVVARARGGAPGVHVVTPLVLASGDAMLVERGWVGAPDGRSANLTELRESVAAAVSGVLMAPSRASGPTPSEQWPIRVRLADPQLLGPRFPYRLIPLVLRRDSTSGAPLRAVPLPELTEGPHLAYAVQWFAFGIIAVVGSVVLFRASGRKSSQRSAIGSR